MTQPKLIAPKLWKSHRLRVVILCFFGLVCSYSHRSNLSMAIVCMSQEKAPTNGSFVSLSTDGDDPIPKSSHNVYATNSNVSDLANNGNKSVPSLDLTEKETTENSIVWDKETKGLLLGSFYWGYLLLQIPSGWLATRFGPTRVTGIGTLSVAILTVLTPIFARTDYRLLLMIRILTGMAQAVLTPCLQAIFSQWVPRNERSTLVSACLAGQNIGTALTFPVSGVLCQYGFDGGWPSIFYLFGAFNVVWSAVWIWFMADCPENSPSISVEEKNYISSKSTIANLKQQKSNQNNIPWMAIVTSRAIWGLFLIHICTNYGQYMMLTELPTFIEEVLDFSIGNNGVVSMLPYLVIWFITTLSGPPTDAIIRNKVISVVGTRKLMSILGCIIPAITMVVIAQFDKSEYILVIILLMVAGGATGFQIPGFYANFGEVTPTYAGVVYAISNTLASVSGILAPSVVSVITKGPNIGREKWAVAFYVCAAIYVFGAFCYGVLGEAGVQKWDPKSDSVTTLDVPETEGSPGGKQRDNGHYDANIYMCNGDQMSSHTNLHTVDCSNENIEMECR